MPFTLTAVLSLLIGVPALLAGVRYRQTDASFHPFLLVVLLGFFNEALSLFIVLHHHSNLLNFNLYSLVECVLLLWQFYRWEAIRSRAIYLGLQVMLVLLWCWEGFVYDRLSNVNSYHLIVSCFVMVLLCIHVMNRTIYESSLPLLRNPVFLVCVGVGTYSLYSVLTELFWLYGLQETQHFRVVILSAGTVINLFANVLFTLAVLWSPTNYRYLMRS